MDQASKPPPMAESRMVDGYRFSLVTIRDEVYWVWRPERDSIQVGVTIWQNPEKPEDQSWLWDIKRIDLELGVVLDSYAKGNLPSLEESLKQVAKVLAENRMPVGGKAFRVNGEEVDPPANEPL